jgi:hypothetical protein
MATASSSDFFINAPCEFDMTRSSQVRAVYRELRRSLDRDCSARQLISYAASLMALYREPPDDLQSDPHEVSLPFERWDVDRAFADGGWRILAFERARLGDAEDDDGDRQETSR